jgi:Kdo2-lipid IVA lauroyltransferase/acyltransferase
MSYFGYLIFRLFTLLFTLIPFRGIYLISDFCFYIVFYVVKYRRKVVQSNLKRVFPEKSIHELKTIEKQYFHFMTDLIFESMKGMSISKNGIYKRHKVTNIEVLDDVYKNHQSIIGVPAHYGNWEWGAFSAGIFLKHNAIAFYKPLTNKYIDAYIRKSRAKFNCTLASIKETFETFNEFVPKNSAFIMAADQCPVNMKDCYWVNFLNQDTPCLHGPEKYARLHNLPVYYIDIQPVKRGFYELHISLLAENPSVLPNGEITSRYMAELEKRIKARPQYWLWSHKRWKRTRENI